MIDIELGFKDTRGLMGLLARNAAYKVSYSDEKLCSPEDSQTIWLGARIPFDDLKWIITSALERYDHLRYYTVSNDFWQKPDFVHDHIFIGGRTKAAAERGLLPVEAKQMLDKLTEMTSAGELFEFVRSHYKGDVPTFEVAGLAAQEKPEAEPIRVLEYLDDSNGEARFAMSINLIVESADEFMDKMRHVKDAYMNWLARRRNEAVLFRLAVETGADNHAAIDQLIKKIYNEEEQLSPLLRAVDFDVTIEDSDGAASIHYVLEGVPAQ